MINAFYISKTVAFYSRWRENVKETQRKETKKHMDLTLTTSGVIIITGFSIFSRRENATNDFRGNVNESVYRFATNTLLRRRMHDRSAIRIFFIWGTKVRATKILSYHRDVNDRSQDMRSVQAVQNRYSPPCHYSSWSMCHVHARVHQTWIHSTICLNFTYYDFAWILEN